jgi:hypothetical protein
MFCALTTANRTHMLTLLWRVASQDGLPRYDDFGPY